MRIGVIGGNGVAATNRLLDMVERRITEAGAFRDSHHPEMIIWQATQAPSRSMFLEGKGPNWIPDYVHIATELKRLGCSIGCMCCNTAHYAIEEIQDKSGLEFINLLEEVAFKCRDSGKRKFVILCTEGARKFDIYGKVFSKVFPRAELFYPDHEKQDLVTRIICLNKTSSRFVADIYKGGNPAKMLTDLCQSFSMPVILGCTDLRIAYKVEDVLPNNVVADSLEVLSDKIIDCSIINENV